MSRVLVGDSEFVQKCKCCIELEICAFHMAEVVLLLSPTKKGKQSPQKSIPRWLCGCTQTSLCQCSQAWRRPQLSGSVLLHNAFIQRCTEVPFHQNGSHVYPQLRPSAATSSPAELRQGGWHLDVLTSFQFLLAVDEEIDPVNDNLD